jgi:hypothetical protein
MFQFIQRHAKNILGTLSGFDRLRFRGTLRHIAYTEGMQAFLNFSGVLLKNFASYMNGTTEQVKAAAKQLAEQQERPLKYLASSGTDKEAIARRMLKDKPVEQGLIGVLSAVENCRSYEIYKNAETKHLELRNVPRKCLHYYFYFNHARFGFMHARLQTWFPFDLRICLNGREWLCRDLDRLEIGYKRRENCLVQVESVKRAQRLLDRQLCTDWTGTLAEIADVVHPLRAKIFPELWSQQYYWSLAESEWATDVMFRSPNHLSTLYPHLIQHAITSYGSRDVLKFLGRKVPTVGINGNFQGEVVSDLKSRPEGMRVKHRVGANSIKMYDKQGSVLRIETTINDPNDFKVYRTKEGDENGDKDWRTLRKGVADVQRRAEVSQAANERYLDGLAAASETTPLSELTEPLCRRVKFGKQYVRGLNPLAADDASLLAAVNRGEFTINGFRNRDLQTLLYKSSPRDAVEQKRRSGVVTRQLRMLRAHGLIKKVPKTHRYQVTAQGRIAITALLAARQADTKKLTAA